MTDEMAPGSGEPSRSGPRDAAVRGCAACTGPDAWMPFGLCCGHPNAPRYMEDWLDDATAITRARVANEHWERVWRDDPRAMAARSDSEDTQPKATPNTETE